MSGVHRRPRQNPIAAVRNPAAWLLPLPAVIAVIVALLAILVASGVHFGDSAAGGRADIRHVAIVLQSASCLVVFGALVRDALSKRARSAGQLGG
jgi:hypothetical protein